MLTIIIEKESILTSTVFVTLACADTGRSTKLIEDVALRISADDGPFLLSSIFFVDQKCGRKSHTNFICIMRYQNELKD